MHIVDRPNVSLFEHIYHCHLSLFRHNASNTQTSQHSGVFAGCQWADVPMKVEIF